MDWLLNTSLDVSMNAPNNSGVRDPASVKRRLDGSINTPKNSGVGDPASVKRRLDL